MEGGLGIPDRASVAFLSVRGRTGMFVLLHSTELFLGQKVLHHLAMHIREPEITPLEVVGEAFVIHAHEV